MRITEALLRQIIRESLADEFRAQLLARKKHYDELAKQPLPYKEGETIIVGNPKPWVGTARGIPVSIEPGTKLSVLALPSPTDGEFKLLEPATLQVTETAVRMMRLTEDTLDVSPEDTIRIQGAQLRNIQQNRFTDREHRLAARLVDRLNDAVYDIANERIKRDGHFLTPEEAEEYFQDQFIKQGMGDHFDSLATLRAAHSEFTDILMRRAER